MKTLLLAVLLLLVTAFSTAQDSKSLYRLPIRHADPWYVYSLLVGRLGFQDSPEHSTIFKDVGGMGGGFGGSGYGGSRRGG